MIQIGQYEVRELLGAGGIGQVHAAFDADLEREVALKSLRPELLNDTSFVERFRAEAKSLARLDHPNITRLYSLLPAGGNLYLVMECVRGETLEDLLKKHGGRLGIRESLAIIAQVADGLTYAHSMGIVHRDIKPSNLMITGNGSVKIMDFGIARVRGSQRLTRDGGIVGTLAYMAPEQLRGEEAEGRSDLYSVAIMLYEMLSGSVPFEADTDYDLMQAHIHTRAPRLSSRVPGLDGRIETAIMRALAKKPEQRFATVRDFSDALGATMLPTDATKIVQEGTRLIERPADIVAPPSELERLVSRLTFIPPGTRQRLVHGVDGLMDRLTFIRPDLRLPAALGAGGLVVVGLALGIIVLLTPIPSSSSGVVANPSVRAASGSVIPPQQSAGMGSHYQELASASPQVNLAPLDTASPVKKEMLADAERNDFHSASALAGTLAAQSNDPDAENLLGQIYEQGLNGPKDDKQALQWYQKSAEQGNVEAENSVGYFFTMGKGTQASDADAVYWFRAAAEKGLPKAEKNLGDMYYQGRGVQQADKREAFEWYQRAAQSNDPGAEFALGGYYAIGRPPVAQDYDQAADWFRKAAAQGSVGAQKALAKLQSQGTIK
jgi:serine/threonine protein kinase